MRNGSRDLVWFITLIEDCNTLAANIDIDHEVEKPEKTVTYREGSWELHGNGTTAPYYWVWVPAWAGAMPPAPPPKP